MGKDLEWGGHGKLQCSIMVFVWSGWSKSEVLCQDRQLQSRNSNAGHLTEGVCPLGSV